MLTTLVTTPRGPGAGGGREAAAGVGAGGLEAPMDGGQLRGTAFQLLDTDSGGLPTLAQPDLLVLTGGGDGKAGENDVGKGGGGTEGRAC